MTAVEIVLMLALLGWSPVEITSYAANCRGCSGITASGEMPVVGRTAACPRSMPFGTRIALWDGERLRLLVCTDRGGAIRGNRIDVFLGSHQEAVRFGRRAGWMTLLKGGAP